MADESCCTAHERQTIALWLAVGYVFVGVNLVINGLAILLPTCVGYALLAIGFWEAASLQTGAWQRFGQFVAVLSAFMALLTLPLLVRFSFPPEDWETYDAWTFFDWYIELLIPLLSPLALWKVFSTRSFRGLMLLIVPVTALALWGADLLNDHHYNLALLCRSGLVPLYCAGLFYWAYKRRDAPKRKRTKYPQHSGR